MSKPTDENIATVMNALEEFFKHMLQTKSFNIKEFVNFMEPKFTVTGYRDVPKLASNNILILTETGAGDFMATTGAIREIRRLYPDANITLTVHPRTFELAECCPYVDEIILDPQDIPTYNLLFIYEMSLKVAPKLLEKRFDLCFAFTMHPNTPLLMYMSGARIRVTTINRYVLDKNNKENELILSFVRLATLLFPCNAHSGHYSDSTFSLLENLLHLPIKNRKQEIWYTPAELSVVKSYLNSVSDSLYSLNMGGTIPKNHYPPDKYAKLLELILRKEPTATFVILGGGQADLDSAAILKSVVPKIYENNIIDLTNKLNFRQSAIALSFCKTHIGNDTGTIHIATAANCPILSPNCFAADLPTSPIDNLQIWYPYGVPSVIVQPKHALPECKKLKSFDPRGCKINAPHCITQIKPETLFRGFQLLKERIAKKINEPLYIH